MATIYNSDTVVIDDPSVEVLPARPKRSFLAITNLSATDSAFLSINDVAVANEGIVLAPGDVMTREVDEAFNESIHGITTGAAVSLAIEERYEDAV